MSITLLCACALDGRALGWAFGGVVSFWVARRLLRAWRDRRRAIAR